MTTDSYRFIEQQTGAQRKEPHLKVPNWSLKIRAHIAPKTHLLMARHLHSTQTWSHNY